jgi:hypothetical protein
MTLSTPRSQGIHHDPSGVEPEDNNVVITSQLQFLFVLLGSVDLGQEH